MRLLTKIFYPVFAITTLLGSAAQEKPNILFIFADDQCFRTVSALGHEEVKTPNLDKLVERGTTFTHAYNMGSWSGAVCVASRHMLNTGAWVWHAEGIANAIGTTNSNKAPRESKTASKKTWPDFQAEGLMWSQLMSQAGYDTYFTGKWHVKADPVKVFDTVLNPRGGMPNQTDEGYNRPVKGKPDKWSPYDPKFEGFWKGGRHWSEVVADDAETFLGTASQDEDPFFMYVAFNAPHDPRQAPKKFVDMYPEDSLLLPPNFMAEYPWNDEIRVGRSLRDEKLAPFPRTPYAVRVNRQEYFAIITHMDEQIGRILHALESSGKADNTWIFFTADHGLAVGEHGLMGKQNIFEHSLRVPFMVVGPGVGKGKKNSSPIYLQDVMPTSLELANAEKPEHVQFDSILPILEGSSSGYSSIYGAYLDGQRAVIKGDYKLALFPQVPKYLVFNVKDDPYEVKDLAGTPEGTEKAKELFPELLKLQEETGDQIELTSIFPDLQ